MTGMLLVEGRASSQLLQRLLSGSSGAHPRAGWVRLSLSYTLNKSSPFLQNEFLICTFGFYFIFFP